MQNITLSPIVLFCYNRLDCLKQTVAALQSNELASESDLFIFSDGTKLGNDSAAVSGVRAYLKTITGFKHVFIKESSSNQGLAKSLIEGISEIITRYGTAIVVEDDILTSPYFLRFMNEALTLYRDEESVAGICGWRPPSNEKLPDVYFIDEVKCWGWATWKRAWNLFEPDGNKLLNQFRSKDQIFHYNCFGTCPRYDWLKKQASGNLDSWAVRWHASVFLNGKLGLQSGENLCANIGYRSGTHYSSENTTPNDIISDQRPVVRKIKPVIAQDILKKVYVPYYLSLFPPETFSQRAVTFAAKILKWLLPYSLVCLLKRFIK